MMRFYESFGILVGDKKYKYIIIKTKPPVTNAVNKEILAKFMAAKKVSPTENSSLWLCAELSKILNINPQAIPAIIKPNIPKAHKPSDIKKLAFS